MLKWFRQYNKYLLVVLGTFLMVAFLIEPAMQMFTPTPAKQTIGTLEGRKVTQGQRFEADAQLGLLRSVASVLYHTAGGEPFDRVDPLQWLLMLEEARRMGLSASQVEVSAVLEAVGMDGPRLDEIAVSRHATREHVREVVRDWLIVQQYKEIMLGLAHVPLHERLGQLSFAQQMLNIGFMDYAYGFVQSSFGKPRISEPLLQRFLHDQQAQVEVSIVPIQALRLAGAMPEPTEQALQELFEAHRDMLRLDPQSQYGLGYRYPDRVKLEFMAVPFDRVRQQVSVPETEALTYYDQNQQEFMIAPVEGADVAGAGQVQPYFEVRDQIIGQLQNQKAVALGNQMIRTARLLMVEEARRGQSEDEGPTGDLGVIAERLQRQFGVLPDVHRRDEQWLSRSQVGTLPGIGPAWVADRPQISFAQYVFAAQPLYESQPAIGEQDAMVGMRLALYEPSLPLTGFGQSFYLFRVIEASPSHEPASLEEVREQVINDAKLVAAYRSVLEARNRWLGRARAEGLEDLSLELETAMVRSRPFSRRELGGSGLAVPNVGGLVGVSETFVDGVFDLVDEVLDAGGIDRVDRAQRVGLVPVDNRLTVFLVRVESFEPMDRATYQQFAGHVQIPMYIHQTLIDGEEISPLSVEAISKRIGYKPAAGFEPEADEPMAALN